MFDFMWPCGAMGACVSMWVNLPVWSPVLFTNVDIARAKLGGSSDSPSEFGGCKLAVALP